MRKNKAYQVNIVKLILLLILENNVYNQINYDLGFENMCGIVGYVGDKQASPILIEGLKRLEYRGYDSAGIAVIDAANSLNVRKEKGKVANLEAILEASPAHGNIGIAHTRWATHGQPEKRNAHPHVAGDIAIVHNGIIENYQELKAQLQAQGAVFISDTDTEVIAHWLNISVQNGATFEQAFLDMRKVLHGAYAIVAIHAGEPNTLYATRHGSPMVISVNENEAFIASDMLALAGYVTNGVYLNEGDAAILQAGNMQIFDKNNVKVERAITQFNVTHQAHDKAGYAHYMLKEIYEQPAIIRKTIAEYFAADAGEFNFPLLKADLSAINNLTIVACGTSFYAAQVMSYWLEQYANVPVRIDIASEFRYRSPKLPEGGAALFISQSGETADTLAALRYCKQAGQHVIAMVNVPTSSMAREADSVIQTLAGAEIGVASTKAFTAQLTTLAALTLAIAKAKQTINDDTYSSLVHGLSEVSDKIEIVLDDAKHYDSLALALMYARDMLFLGRGTSYPLANEGALKMKEISYIHAEGYAAGELKHGPIALVDDGVPIIVIAPDDELFEKSASNLEETAARKGNVVLISSAEKIANFKGNMTHSASVPHCHSFYAPILYAVPLQLLAYYVALHKGADIDQPRNLAKSVTVE
jgi:glutamine---fructose-6-phosphate transaminase (isomerizing)